MLLIFFLAAIACQKEDISNQNGQTITEEFVSAVDISSYPEIADSKPTYYNLQGVEQDFLTILKENGVNTIRLRLWVNPENDYAGFSEVKAFSERLKIIGFKTWITLHYSDTWADPGTQQTPTQWQGLDMETLLDSVYHYTARVVQEIKPNYLQIGNEINSGILHPQGNISTNYADFIRLIQVGCSAVRKNSQACKIILHYAGHENGPVFFDSLSQLDYDIIGLSYYPIWHGKSLDALKNTLRELGRSHNKQTIIAETAYPFTLEWNDWTNNIVGLDEQLILPEYPASVDGQRAFVKAIKEIVRELESGIGFCYWGAELTAWKGEEATDASPWENQALFDFTNQALPALLEFKVD